MRGVCAVGSSRRRWLGLFLVLACGPLGCEGSSSDEATSKRNGGLAQTTEGEVVYPDTTEIDDYVANERNEACDYHGTNSPSDPVYTAFETDLEGARGYKRTIRQQVNTHEVGGVSIAIIEDGRVTQHHWYGCEDRKALKHTTANTVYQAASMSKAVSAQGLVEAARTGELDLNRSIYDYGVDHINSTFHGWVQQEFVNTAHADWARVVNATHLLNMSSGLNAPSVGTFAPGTSPTFHEALRGDRLAIGGVSPIHEPRTVWDYSGGGYVAAELLLELQTGASFKDYLRDHVLVPYGMTHSNYELATTSTPNLARGCSRDTCSYNVMQTTLKAAGGLQTTVRDYARFATLMGNWGVDPANNRQVIPRANVETALLPAQSKISSMVPCTEPGKLIGWYGPPVEGFADTCVAGAYRRLLLDGEDSYGLGLQLRGAIRTDGYHFHISHGGSHVGFKSYFTYRRNAQRGIVIMINGEDDFVRDGFTYGAQAFLDEIRDAFERHYE
jgi:CubicO group peptidase (beta-lactamase class C family)